jgi:four helix bundle protein
MATVTDFRNFEGFKACRAFVREIGLLVRTRKFVPNRRLADQMERASISALSNFAEGFEREGNSEFIQFLAISKGSIGELRAQLIYALDLGLLSGSHYDALDGAAESATRLLGGLMRYLSGSAKRGVSMIENPSDAAQSELRTATYKLPTVSLLRGANCLRTVMSDEPVTANCKPQTEQPLTRSPLNDRTGPSQAAAENDQENVVTNLDPAGTVSFVERHSDSSCRRVPKPI